MLGFKLEGEAERIDHCTQPNSPQKDKDGKVVLCKQKALLCFWQLHGWFIDGSDSMLSQRGKFSA